MTDRDVGGKYKMGDKRFIKKSQQIKPRISLTHFFPPHPPVISDNRTKNNGTNVIKVNNKIKDISIIERSYWYE